MMELGNSCKMMLSQEVRKMEKKKGIPSLRLNLTLQMKTRNLGVTLVAKMTKMITQVVMLTVKMNFQKRECHGKIWKNKPKKRIEQQLVEDKQKIFIFLLRIRGELEVVEEEDDEIPLNNKLILITNHN